MCSEATVLSGRWQMGGPSTRLSAANTPSVRTDPGKSLPSPFAMILKLQHLPLMRDAKCECDGPLLVAEGSERGVWCIVCTRLTLSGISLAGGW